MKEIHHTSNERQRKHRQQPASKSLACIHPPSTCLDFLPRPMHCGSGPVSGTPLPILWNSLPWWPRPVLPQWHPVLKRPRLDTWVNSVPEIHTPLRSLHFEVLSPTPRQSFCWNCSQHPPNSMVGAWWFLEKNPCGIMRRFRGQQRVRRSKNTKHQPKDRRVTVSCENLKANNDTLDTLPLMSLKNIRFDKFPKIVSM